MVLFFRVARPTRQPFFVSNVSSLSRLKFGTIQSIPVIGNRRILYNPLVDLDGFNPGQDHCIKSAQPTFRRVYTRRWLLGIDRIAAQALID